MSNPGFLNEIFHKYSISGVIHLAGFKAVGESVANPIKYYENNIGCLINILKVMRAHGCNFLYLVLMQQFMEIKI